MSYNVFSGTAPAMPKPAKGTEFCKLLLSQASKDMYEPLVPMFFPILGAQHQRCGISVPGPQLEGANGHDGQPCGSFWR